ncbi:HK97 gp10 family phage protein [Actinoallomurus sp. NPDC052274]|uniref:HK97 gp10 family phage protein n=1 Tax=Actinoallomurus sp. NPDC052274 TaxID=3155420 RepID=UPI00342CD1DF
MKVVISPGDIDAELTAALDAYLDTQLGPAIASDAQRYAPKRTGHLASTIGHHVEDHRLVVYATASYAAYVEMGHRVAHGPGMSLLGPKVVAPQPYLRAALYTERDL